MLPHGIQTEDDIDKLFRTSQLTTSYPGTSQYATGAVSSCGMAAANFARTVIKLVGSAGDPDDVLKRITSLDKIQVFSVGFITFIHVLTTFPGHHVHLSSVGHSRL